MKEGNETSVLGGRQTGGPEGRRPASEERGALLDNPEEMASKKQYCDQLGTRRCL